MQPLAKIVLVDDDRNFAESNRALLAACGYEVHVAYDGATGLELIRKEKPALVVLDVMMKTNTEGFDIARQIAADNDLKQTRIILLTGMQHALHLPFDFEPDAKWLPVARILEKPIAPALFLAEIEKVFKQEGVSHAH